MPLVIYPTNLTPYLTVINLKQQYNWYGQKPCLGQYYFSPVNKKYMYSSMIDNTDCYFIELCLYMYGQLSISAKDDALRWTNRFHYHLLYARCWAP